LYCIGTAIGMLCEETTYGGANTKVPQNVFDTFRFGDSSLGRICAGLLMQCGSTLQPWHA